MQQHMQHIIITEKDSVKESEDRSWKACPDFSGTEVIPFLRFENLAKLLF
jgi:tetraacyldisaccharide-1-P 4'-kinase